MKALPPEPAVLHRLIDVEELASFLGVGVRHIRRLVAERRIPYIKVGHFVRFDPDDVTRWLEELRIDQFEFSEMGTVERPFYVTKRPTHRRIPSSGSEKSSGGAAKK